jgi:hypothetical protein
MEAKGDQRRTIRKKSRSDVEGAAKVREVVPPMVAGMPATAVLAKEPGVSL